MLPRSMPPRRLFTRLPPSYITKKFPVGGTRALRGSAVPLARDRCRCQHTRVSPPPNAPHTRR
eukprot:4442817-Prymnesium_polylepis.1